MRRLGLPALGLLLAAALTAPAQAQVAAPVLVSTDPYGNPESQHQTEVEPDTYSHGSAVLAAFMVGRTEGGAANIGWAFSPDAGDSWSSGFLPSLTRHSAPPGPADRAADPSVAYDARHGVWMINTLAVKDDPGVQAALLVSRSADGVNWEAPVTVSGYARGHDKNWIACDNTATSPYFGHCYVAWTNFDAGAAIEVSRSTDGGLTWGPPVRPDGNPDGFGVQVVVRPDGQVVIVALSRLQQTMLAVRSIDGGFSFSSAVQFTEVRHRPPAGYRNNPFPSAGVDAGGRIYVAWQDCRFRNLCLDSGHDTVLSTSDDALSWSPVRAIRPPAGAGATAPAGADFLQPGLAVDPGSSGDTARLGLYVYYTDRPCGALSGDCELNMGFTFSNDGGMTWAPAARLNPEPVKFSWLTRSATGRMTGDYISSSFAGGKVVAVYPLASEPPEPGSLRQAMYASALPVEPAPGGGGPAGGGGLGGLLSYLVTLLLQLLPGL